MKAFRVKLFGKFITRLPEFNLTRHEDVPLPESYAEPYHSKGEVVTAKFVPSQDLSGSLIPVTGQDENENRLRKKKERDDLLEQYHKMAEESGPELAPPEDEELDAGYELVSTEDRLICIPSEHSDEGKIVTQQSSDIVQTSSRSARDTAMTEKVIKQLAFEQESELKPPKSQWVFSAQVSLSLKKEIVDDVKPMTPALSSGPSKKLIKEDADTLEEEGVEIAMLGEVSPTGENVSVFYVDDDKDCGSQTIGSSVKEGKRISFKEPVDEID